MGSTVTRNVKKIRIIDAAVFSVLTYMWPATTSGDVTDQTTIQYPPNTELTFVKSFQLQSGAIKVVYYGASGQQYG